MKLQDTRPHDDIIRQSLDKVLASGVFARSERLRAFLAYIVEKEMEGTGHQLKGYTIGIDVFERPQAFNADSDPLVRVHAGKLRKSLDAYYASEGATDPWRIVVPKGTYIPEYKQYHRETAPDSAAVESKIKRPARKRLNWLPAPLSSPRALLPVLPFLIFAPLASPAMTVNMKPAANFQARLTGQPALSYELPRVTLLPQGPDIAASLALAKAVRSASSYYRTISKVSISDKPVATGATAPALAFTAHISHQADPGGLLIVLTHDKTGVTVATSFIADDRIEEDSEMLYESVSFAARTLGVQGDIFRFVSREQLGSSLMDCMLLTENYRLEQTRDTFAEARACQTRLAPSGRNAKFTISANILPASVGH